MKRALVFTCVLLLGVGFASFAQFSGTWETEIELYPAAQTFADFAAFSSDFDLDFTFGDWVFTMEAGFDPAGLTAMDFEVVGVLGAFSLSAELGFDPMSVTSYIVTYDDPAVQSPSCLSGGAGVVYDSVTEVVETQPVFDDLTLEADVSIAGVTFGGMFKLFGEQVTTVSKGYTYFTSLPSYTGAFAIGSADPFTVTSTAGNGAGWKFWGMGSVGAMDVTANLWLNLEDYWGDLYTLYSYFVEKNPPLSYKFADSGTYSLVCEDCIGRFTGFDVLLEGFSFACTDVAIFTSFDCCGWNGISFLLEDIGLGCCWDLAFDMLIDFTVNSKSITFQPDLTIANACFTIEAEVAYSGGDQSQFSIDGINILGVGLSYAWNGVTFTSMTTLDPVNNPILGGFGYGYISSPNEIAVWSPVIGTATATFATVDGECKVTGVTGGLVTEGAGFYELKTFACERATVWEYFEIAVDGDGCCGGGFDVEAAFYFGDILTLTDLDGTYRLDKDGSGSYEESEETIIYGDGSANSASGKITAWSEGCNCCPCDECSQEIEEVEWDAVYTAETTGTRLFDWIMTSVEGSIGMASNFELTFGLDVSAWGWEEVSVGFEFTF